MPPGGMARDDYWLTESKGAIRDKCRLRESRWDDRRHERRLPLTAIELTIDEGTTASADRFFRAGVDLLSLLDELSDVPVDWVISGLELGSAVARISTSQPDPVGDAALGAAVHGLAGVVDHATVPSSWTPDAVAAARRLASIADRDEGAPLARSHLRLVEDAATSRVDLTPQLSEDLAGLQPVERLMPGAVRGRLVGFNISRGNRASLKDSNGRVVRVRFGDHLRVRLRDALMNDVELTGMVRKDIDGRTFHVQADDVRIMQRPSLRWRDLYGADPALTGDLSTEEYLEASRGQA